MRKKGVRDLMQYNQSEEAGKPWPAVRIYKDVDSRYILEDLIAKLELYTCE